MTIKKRFTLTFVGGILISLFSFLLIFGFVFYVSTSTLPTPNRVYKTISTQRPLSESEQLIYLQLRQLAKQDSQALLMVDDLNIMLSAFENDGIKFVVKKDQTFIYYSNGLAESSLTAHAPLFDARNLDTRGTMDNQGRMYRYLKFDFYFNDHSQGTFMVLKQENNLFEFLSRWGILVLSIIVGVALLGLYLLHYFLKKSMIDPIYSLNDTIKQYKEDWIIKEPRIEKHVDKEIIQLQHDFFDLQQALSAAKDEQTRIELNRKSMMASLSHDVKTPMTTIIGYVEGLLDGVAKDEVKQHQYYKMIHEKSLLLNDLMDTLFLYSKLDAQDLSFHFETIHLTSFIQHIVDEYQLGQELNICFKSCDQTVMIRADRLHLSRVFYNIIDNSIKYQANNRRFILMIELKQIENQAVIVLKDNGVGMNPTSVEHAFEIFYREDQARTTQQGSGLGLAIVKQIVMKHDGTVKLSSEEGVGTTVTLTFKIDEGENANE